MREVLCEVALRLSKVVAIMIGTRPIDVEVAADLGSQWGPLFHASNLSLVPTQLHQELTEYLTSYF